MFYEAMVKLRLVSAFYGDTDIIDGALDCDAWGAGQLSWRR